MKLKRRKVKRGRVEIIPMIDTIIILLIFYMSFSRFVEQSREASIELPRARAGDEFRAFPGQVIVNMFASDRMSVDNNEYTIDQLPDILRGFRVRLREQLPDVTISVVLRANRDMTYKDLSAFMRACASAQVADVTFATLEGSL